ncbi:hypothetical protein MMC22_008620, partial [Lobaria immixta]|nr:hypothetical protein [Lobaria immixta]
ICVGLFRGYGSDGNDVLIANGIALHNTGKEKKRVSYHQTVTKSTTPAPLCLQSIHFRRTYKSKEKAFADPPAAITGKIPCLDMSSYLARTISVWPARSPEPKFVADRYTTPEAVPAAPCSSNGGESVMLSVLMV